MLICSAANAAKSDVAFCSLGPKMSSPVSASSLRRLLDGGLAPMRSCANVSVFRLNEAFLDGGRTGGGSATSGARGETL